jgi:hypothetical protein
MFFSQRNSTRSCQCFSPRVAGRARGAPPSPRGTRGYHLPAAAARRLRRLAPPRRLDSDARPPLVGLLRIALVPALRVLSRTCPCLLHWLRPLAGRPLHPYASRAAVAVGSRSGLSVRVGSSGHHERWPSLSQSRRPAFLMMTADSSRSPRVLLLLTVR